MRIPFCLLLTVSLCCAATQGTVVDPSGRPVRGARVECAGESVTTDEEGRFSVVGGR
jgi:hypothetical protein